MALAHLARNRARAEDQLASVLYPGETVLDVGPARMERHPDWPIFNPLFDPGGEAAITNLRLIYTDAHGVFMVGHGELVRLRRVRCREGRRMRHMRLIDREGNETVVSGGKLFTRSWRKIYRRAARLTPPSS